MIHQYKLGNYNIVLDVCSGSVHAVDEVAYDMIAMFEQNSREEILAAMEEKYAVREDISKEEILKQNIFGLGVPHPTSEYTIGQYTALAINRLTFSYHENLEEKVFKATHAGLTEDEMVIPLILLTKKSSR